jgi:MFS family permease
MQVTLGLKDNWQQFGLLVAVNAFVGGMVGMERSILPVLAENEFGIASKTAAVSFIATFGLAKAVSNLFAGELSQRFSRRTVLITGWLFGLPVPFMLILAPSWGWVIGANALLGLNQGLAWSMTVNMKLDLVGPRRRGLALGFNEAAGYLAVAAAAFMTGVIAEQYGVRPEPFYMGIAFAAFGLGISVLLVRDTAAFVALEATHTVARSGPPSAIHSFADLTWRRPQLFGITQAGFVKNLNDGLVWGIFPLFFASRGLGLDRIATLAAIYPMVWGVLQLGTGWASDHIGRKPLIVAGMFLQGAAIFIVGVADFYSYWIAAVALLGIGTALVYPTLLAAIGDAVLPRERATSLGVFRFWRDSGAVVGSLGAGALADLFGFGVAIQSVAALTVVSGILAATTMRRTQADRSSHQGTCATILP